MAERIRKSIPQGTLIGLREDSLQIFKNIPYAAPPVGDLRFRPPAAPPHWDDERDGTVFGPAPLQPDLPAAVIPELALPDPSAGRSEDCLTLNIWTAGQEGAALPVIVWVYGGGWIAGGSSAPVYDGAAVARHGAVFVSVNYRLGPFGFLCCSALSKEDPDGTSGNYGYLDVVAALRWVKENIAAFGGNPDNITLAGQSAGAALAELVTVSPECRGLVQRAFIMSYLQIHRGLPAAGEEMRREDRHLPEDVTAEDLRSMSTDQILAIGRRYAGWSPVVDGTHIPNSVFDAYRNGGLSPVDMLTGGVSGDYFMAGGFAAREASVPSRTKQEFIDKVLGSFHGMASRALLSAYPPENWKTSAASLQRDQLMGLYYLEARMRGKGGAGKTWLYFSTLALPGLEDRGAFHGADIPAWLGSQDDELGDLLCSMLVRFAETGSPQTEDFPDYPDFLDVPGFLELSEDGEYLSLVYRCTQADGIWQGYADTVLMQYSN